MNANFNPGDGLLFMKIGVHAKEPLESIIKRKLKEIKDEGICMWGYGGGTCHPINAVQPFVAQHVSAGQTIYLCMQEMTSKHYAEPERANYFSEDGKNWTEIPKGINVRGSRYAMVLKSLEPVDFALPLAETQVGIGNSQGRRGDLYVRGRVDKACLNYAGNPSGAVHDPKTITTINYVAEVAQPYAVLLKL